MFWHFVGAFGLFAGGLLGVGCFDFVLLFSLGFLLTSLLVCFCFVLFATWVLCWVLDLCFVLIVLLGVCVFVLVCFVLILLCVDLLWLLLFWGLLLVVALC